MPYCFILLLALLQKISICAQHIWIPITIFISDAPKTSYIPWKYDSNIHKTIDTFCEQENISKSSKASITSYIIQLVGVSKSDVSTLNQLSQESSDDSLVLLSLYEKAYFVLDFKELNKDILSFLIRIEIFCTLHQIKYHKAFCYQEYDQLFQNVLSSDDLRLLKDFNVNTLNTSLRSIYITKWNEFVDGSVRLFHLNQTITYIQYLDIVNNQEPLHSNDQGVSNEGLDLIQSQYTLKACQRSVSSELNDLHKSAYFSYFSNHLAGLRKSQFLVLIVQKKFSSRYITNLEELVSEIKGFMNQKVEKSVNVHVLSIVFNELTTCEKSLLLHFADMFVFVSGDEGALISQLEPGAIVIEVHPFGCCFVGSYDDYISAEANYSHRYLYLSVNKQTYYLYFAGTLASSWLCWGWSEKMQSKSFCGTVVVLPLFLEKLADIPWELIFNPKVVVTPKTSTTLADESEHYGQVAFVEPFSDQLKHEALLSYFVQYKSDWMSDFVMIANAIDSANTLLRSHNKGLNDKLMVLILHEAKNPEEFTWMSATNSSHYFTNITSTLMYYFADYEYPFDLKFLHYFVDESLDVNTDPYIKSVTYKLDRSVLFDTDGKKKLYFDFEFQMGSIDDILPGNDLSIHLVLDSHQSPAASSSSSSSSSESDIRIHTNNRKLSYVKLIGKLRVKSKYRPFVHLIKNATQPAYAKGPLAHEIANIPMGLGKEIGYFGCKELKLACFDPSDGKTIVTFESFDNAFPQWIGNDWELGRRTATCLKKPGLQLVSGCDQLGGIKPWKIDFSLPTDVQQLEALSNTSMFIDSEAITMIYDFPNNVGHTFYALTYMTDIFDSGTYFKGVPDVILAAPHRDVPSKFTWEIFGSLPINNLYPWKLDKNELSKLYASGRSFERCYKTVKVCRLSPLPSELDINIWRAAQQVVSHQLSKQSCQSESESGSDTLNYDDKHSNILYVTIASNNRGDLRNIINNEALIQFCNSYIFAANHSSSDSDSSTSSDTTTSKQTNKIKTKCQIHNFGHNFHKDVCVMQNTDLFISIHGATLINIFFMKQGSHVVEVRNSKMANLAWQVEEAFERPIAKMHYQTLRFWTVEISNTSLIFPGRLEVTKKGIRALYDRDKK